MSIFVRASSQIWAEQGILIRIYYLNKLFTFYFERYNIIQWRQSNLSDKKSAQANYTSIK